MYISNKKFKFLYIKLKEVFISRNLEKNINYYSNNDLVKSNICKSIKDAKDIRKFIKSKATLREKIFRIIFNKYDSYNTCWENKQHTKQIFPYIIKKSRWKKFKFALK